MISPKLLILIKKLIVIFVFTFSLVCCIPSKSSYLEYDRIVWEGMVYYKAWEYKIALSRFAMAFDLRPLESKSDYFYAASSALYLNKSDLAENYINIAIKYLGSPKSYFEYFPGFDQFRETDMLRRIEVQCDSLHQSYTESKADDVLYQNILELIEKDQAVREARPLDWEAMAIQDSLNILELIGLTKEYGWSEQAWILLWHQRGSYIDKNWVWDFLKQFITEQIRLNNIRPSFWASFKDFALWQETNQLLYGAVYQEPLRNPAIVDPLRYTVGLPPLWYLVEVFDQPVPLNYNVDPYYFTTEQMIRILNTPFYKI